MINPLEESLAANYKPLIPEELWKGSNELKLPWSFRALFSKEASVKYAVMESLSDMSVAGEYSILSKGEQKYIDIYCFDGKNSYGIEVKADIGKLMDAQMESYFNSGKFDYIYLVYPIVYETVDKFISIYRGSVNTAEVNQNIGSNQSIFAKAAINKFGTTGRVSRGLSKFNMEVKNEVISSHNQIKKELRTPAIEFLKGGLGRNFGIIAINPLGGVQTLFPPKLCINSGQNTYSTYATESAKSISKPEERIKLAVWKHFRKKKSLIVAEASLISSLKKSMYWQSPDGQHVKIDKSDKELYMFSGGGIKTFIEGSYIIDFVTAEFADGKLSEEVVGIECKASSSNIDLRQLKSYYDSLELDRLYLAIGEIKPKEINDFFPLDRNHWTSKIGIIEVTKNNEILFLKEAQKLNAPIKVPFSVYKGTPKVDYGFGEILSVPILRQ